MRSLFVGIGVVAALVGGPGVVLAQGSEPSPKVKTVRGAGAVTVTLSADRLRVSQRVSKKAFTLTIAEGADRVEFSGDRNGNVVIRRAGRVVRFGLPSASAADLTSTASLLAGSPALTRFEHVMESSWAKSARDAVVFVSARRMLSAVQGQSSGARHIVQTMAKVQPRESFRRVNSPQDCWNSYTSDVIDYTYQLESCLANAADSWNPLATAWCAYEYDLKATLAFIWLLECSGVGILT